MKWRDEKTLIMLAAGTLFFTGVTLFVSYTRPNDGQLYTLFGTMVSGFSSALLLHLKPNTAPPPPGSTTVADVHQVTQTPPDPEKKQ